MNDFTDEQIAALKEIADAQIAEDAEIASRNQAVDAHTAKLDELNKAALELAAKHGVDPSTFQLQSQPAEASSSQQAFDNFTSDVANLAKEQGLDGFAVQKVNT